MGWGRKGRVGLVEGKRERTDMPVSCLCSWSCSRHAKRYKMISIHTHLHTSPGGLSPSPNISPIQRGNEAANRRCISWLSFIVHFWRPVSETGDGYHQRYYTDLINGPWVSIKVFFWLNTGLNVACRFPAQIVCRWCTSLIVLLLFDESASWIFRMTYFVY